jgi:N-methylhydantoinase A/oxoprolinase/acetone carboxylase beta subunit
VGADTGGTFTDFVTDTGAIAKVPSDPDSPAAPLRAGLTRLGGAGTVRVLAHGTTVATNALLQRRGGRVALVATCGFADEIEIARQTRPSLYDQSVDRPAPLVARSDRYEVPGRLDAAGREIEPLDHAAVPEPAPGCDSVAVCLLHADLDPSHEQAVAAALRARGLVVRCSHEVSPEFREYERMVTTVVDAMLQPVCRAYLGEVVHLAPEVLVMTSAGGLVPAADAVEHPAALLLSGPAAGVRAAAALAAAVGVADAVSFDMGGTSTDVCLVRGGVPEPAPSLVIADVPIRLPALDVHTIGAGGGSIAAIDPGGALTVGPRSAGAVPGPACYGRGGTLPTVTDADLVLGRIPADAPFPGLGTLDPDAARRALAREGVDPAGVVAVVDESMREAVRRVTVARGVDPRGLALVAFGGAGPLHACEVAGGLGMSTVIVPPRAGVFSAVGLVDAPVQHELVRSWPAPADPTGLDAALAALGHEARSRLAGADVETFVDCRYAGQSHELTVPTVADFAAEHARRNGYAAPDRAVEVVLLRARVRAPAPAARLGAAPRRPRLTGPAVHAEGDCTVWIPAGWTATPGPAGAWLIRRGGSQR